MEKHKNSSGRDNKYYIDCDSIDPSTIETVKIMKNLKPQRRVFDRTVLIAIAHSDLIRKKNRHIVVKIDRIKSGNEYMAIKEYETGKKLHGLNGFIKFLCLFSCYDNTSSRFNNIDEMLPVETNQPICSSDNKNDEKFVLVMPFISGGSLLNYNWSSHDMILLKSLIIHATLSLAEAFIKIGFIHGDLHWGNVLFKKTTQSDIKYDIYDEQLTIPSNGYKVVIMDFEKSKTNITRTSEFWIDIQELYKKHNGIQNKLKEQIVWYYSKLDTKIKEMIDDNTHISYDILAKMIIQIYDSDLRLI